MSAVKRWPDRWPGETQLTARALKPVERLSPNRFALRNARRALECDHQARGIERCCQACAFL